MADIRQITDWHVSTANSALYEKMLASMTSPQTSEGKRIFVVDGAEAGARSRLTNRRAEGADDGVDGEELVVFVEMVEVDDVGVELRRSDIR